MSLTSTALKRNRVTATLIAVCVLGGASAYQSMPRQMDPGFIIRVAMIVTNFPGASPERVENLITDPIEEVAKEIPELDFVSSTSRSGQSVVLVSIREEFRDMAPIWTDLRNSIDDIRDRLPDGIIGPNVNDDFGDTYPLLYTITAGEGFSDRELEDIADAVKDELLRDRAVAKVDVLGAQDERVFINYDNARLTNLGVSPLQLQSLLASRNIILPGGELNLDGEAIVLEPSGNFQTVDDVRRTLLQLPGGELVALGDLVEVERGTVDPPVGQVRSEDTRGLTLAVSMSEGGNLLELGSRVRTTFAGLPAQYPHGIDFVETYFQPAEVDQKVDDFIESVLQAIAIVLGVMLLSLGLRTGLVVSALIPTTMVIAILVMSVVGIQIDQMSLAALIIALGLLVDNALVVSEATLVGMQEGQSPFEATVAAAKELQVPLLTSSLTTAAAFLPIYLAESAVGEYTGVLFEVVTITLLISWLLALTFIPLLCTLFLKAKPQAEGEDAFDTPFYRFYRRALGLFLRGRWLTLAAVGLAFVLGMQLFGLIPNIFFPSREGAFFMAQLKMPPAARFEETQAMIEDVDDFIRQEIAVTPASAGDTEAGGEEGVTSWTSYIGLTPQRFELGYNPAPPKPYFSEILLTATSDEGKPALMRKLEEYVIANYPDVETYIRPLSNGPAVDKPIQIRLSGRNTEGLFAEAERIKAKLAETPGVVNIGDDWGARVKKLVVRVDEGRARRAGVTNQDVAVALQTFLSGLQVTEFREDENVIPVTMRSVVADEADVDRLDTLSVFGTNGPVPLRQVADVELEFQPSEILRRNALRTLTVYAKVTADTTAIDVINGLTPWLEEQQEGWGLDYRFELGGEVESSVKANASIGAKLPIAGLIIILLLVTQFNSIRKSVIVLATMPLALIGVGIGLYVMGSSFGFMTLLGVVSLMGIVINNAIVLIERIELERYELGRPAAEAIIEAAQRRMRPILLTTATTIASLIPLYLGGGAMWEPMSVAIMYGLAFSTVLTLGVVPLLYAMFYRVDMSGGAGETA
ncbi:MAG: efflux RND transporter permease subunit [Myxococcota bacterium]